MKITIQNLNKYSVGYKGRYYPSISQREIEGDIEKVKEYNNHKDLKVSEIRDIDFSLNLDDLQLIAKINNIPYSGSTKSELISKLKGEEVKEEIKEVGDE